MVHIHKRANLNYYFDRLVIVKYYAWRAKQRYFPIYATQVSTFLYAFPLILGGLPRKPIISAYNIISEENAQLKPTVKNAEQIRSKFG